PRGMDRLCNSETAGATKPARRAVHLTLPARARRIGAAAMEAARRLGGARDVGAGDARSIAIADRGRCRHRHRIYGARRDRSTIETAGASALRGPLTSVNVRPM